MDMNNVANSKMLKGPGSMVAEFFEFLKKFGVIGLAIGVVVGGAVKEFVDAIVKTVVDPIVKTVLSAINFKPGGAIAIGKDTAGMDISILFGDLLSATINFFVLMLLVFICVKFLISKFLHENDTKNAGV
jgi:large conductance mechanosensitive channel